MELDQAIEMMKKIVKNNGTTDINTVDLGLVPALERPKYQKALIVIKVAIMEGKISQDEVFGRAQLG